MDKVFVSGGTGYIAQHCIVELIKNGFSVKTSIRTKSRKQEVIDSISKIVDCNNKLEICYLDLLEDEGWDDAIYGCKYVIHAASPVSLLSSNNIDDLVRPAVDGLRRCLFSSIKNNVKKFIMTSSFSAIGAGSKKNEISDQDWTNLDNPNISPYDISKTKAEKFLWDYFLKEDNSNKIEVCTINPVIVVGPSLSMDIGISNQVVKKLLDGSMPFTPKCGLNLVDVKDVAKIHVKAMLSSATNGKRFLLSAKSLWFQELAQILRNNGYKRAPKFNAPNFLIKFLSNFDKELEIVIFYLGFKNKLRCVNAKNILKWEPSRIEKSIIETANQMLEYGIIEK